MEMRLRLRLVVVHDEGVAGGVAHALARGVVRARQVDHAVAELAGEPVGPVQGLRWKGWKVRIGSAKNVGVDA